MLAPVIAPVVRLSLASDWILLCVFIDIGKDYRYACEARG